MGLLGESRRRHYTRTTIVNGNWYDLQGDLNARALRGLIDQVAYNVYQRDESSPRRSALPSAIALLPDSGPGEPDLVHMTSNSAERSARSLMTLALVQNLKEHSLECLWLMQVYEGMISDPGGEMMTGQLETTNHLLWAPGDPNPQIISALFDTKEGKLVFRRVLCLPPIAWTEDNGFGNIWEDAKTVDLSGVSIVNNRAGLRPPRRERL